MGWCLNSEGFDSLAPAHFDVWLNTSMSLVPRGFTREQCI